MARATFETRVKRERKRLDQVFADIPEDRKAVVDGLLENAAFMRVTLQDLQADIKKNGETELFQQGKDQEPYLRERPESKKFDTRNANYQKIMKLLLDELPKGTAKPGGDDFDDF